MNKNLPAVPDNGKERVIDLGTIPRDAVSVRVHDLTARVKKITTTDEGKLQVVLEAEGMDDKALSQVKDMLVLQQTCPVKVRMDPVQRDLFDA